MAKTHPADVCVYSMCVCVLRVCVCTLCACVSVSRHGSGHQRGGCQKESNIVCVVGILIIFLLAAIWLHCMCVCAGMSVCVCGLNTALI